MKKILKGVARFRNETFPQRQKFYEHLAAKQQKPIALFITCSDSRIDPNLLTGTEPGDVFILRNAGNIIPPFGAAVGGEGATIEYAVSVLGVKHVIVCGHSECGAMAALLADQLPDNLPAVRGWFAHAEATRQIINNLGGDLDPKTKRERAIEQNVLVQLTNLRTHPSIAAGLTTGDLELHGWIYKIQTGEVHAYNPFSRSFELVQGDTDEIQSAASASQFNMPAYASSS